MLIPEIRYNCNDATNYLNKFVVSILRIHARIKIFIIFFTLSFLYFTVAPENLQRHFYNASSYFLVTFSDPKLVPRPFLIHTLISSVTKLTHAVNFLFPNSVIICPMFELQKKKKKHSIFAMKISPYYIYIFLVSKRTKYREEKERERGK